MVCGNTCTTRHVQLVQSCWKSSSYNFVPKCWLKLIHWDHIVYLVGLYIYYKMIHGPYNVKLNVSLTEITLEFNPQWILRFFLSHDTSKPNSVGLHVMGSVMNSRHCTFTVWKHCFIGNPGITLSKHIWCPKNWRQEGMYLLYPQHQFNKNIQLWLKKTVFWVLTD